MTVTATSAATCARGVPAPVGKQHEARLAIGCPVGDKPKAAHEARNLSTAYPAGIDFAAPESARGRLVPPLRDHLGEAEPDAREGVGQADHSP